MSFTVDAQIVDIPDATFKNRLTYRVVADLDGDGTFESNVDTNGDCEM